MRWRNKPHRSKSNKSCTLKLHRNVSSWEALYQATGFHRKCARGSWEELEPLCSCNGNGTKAVSKVQAGGARFVWFGSIKLITSSHYIFGALTYFFTVQFDRWTGRIATQVVHPTYYSQEGSAALPIYNLYDGISYTIIHRWGFWLSKLPVLIFIIQCTAEVMYCIYAVFYQYFAEIVTINQDMITTD